jgi:aminodeoxyfutalosine deaminase
MTSTALPSYIRSLPKAELHLHLEGSIEMPTLARLAEVHGLPAPRPELYDYAGFGGFLMAFKTVCEYLKTPQDYHLVTLRMLESLHAHGVIYAEIFVSAGVMLWKGESFEELFEGIEAGAKEGFARYGVRVQWVLDAVRQFGPQAAQRVAELAARFQHRGVIGFGIGGDEQKAPPEQFRDVFAYARSKGLRRAVHAGEVAGPESITGALDALAAERIGHGVSAIQDPALVRRLADSQIPVDICLSSNLRTGAVASLKEHPFRNYFDAGVLVSLSTDDPAMFQTNLSREYLLAQEKFGFTEGELARLAANSFRASFLSEEEKSRYTATRGCRLSGPDRL